MKRVLTAAALVLFFNPIQAQAHHREGPCPIHWYHEWTEDQNVGPIKRIITCAADRWPVAGGAHKALSVAACESGFRPTAYGSGNGGVFQHRLPYWPARYDSLTRPRWHLKSNVLNGRTNVIVSIRMAHRYGWAAWSCA